MENAAFNGPQGTGLPVPGAPTRFMKGAGGRPNSPSFDLGRKHWSSVGISRDLDLNSSIPLAIKERLSTYVLGSGLIPEPHINHKYANVGVEDAREYEAIIARHYQIWETNTRSTWEQSHNPLALEKQAFNTWIVSGDFFVMFPYTSRPNWPYNMTLKVIAPDFVRTPEDFNIDLDKRDVENGVERNEEGRDILYWVANFYKSEEDSFNTKQKHIAYKVMDEVNGRKFIHHIYSPVRLGQRRGIPFIAPVVEMIQAVTQLTESQLNSAVISSYFNVIVTDDDNAIDTFQEAYNEYETVTGGGSEINEEGSPIAYDKDEGEEHELELGSGGVHYLPGSKKVTIANPNKESNSFEPFFKAIVMQIGAATGIAYEVLMQNFTSSYSASRAAILMSFKKFLQMRTEWVNTYKKPLYEEFIIDLALQGVIPVSAQELITNPWKMAAWSSIEWRGPSMGHLNPLDEVNAAEKRIEIGISTKEIEFKETNNMISYPEMNDTWKAEQQEYAEHRDMLNQEYPLNTVPKTTITRSYYDIDSGGGGDINNAKEQLKAQRKENVNEE